MQPRLRSIYVRLGSYLFSVIVFLAIVTPRGLAWLLPCLAVFAAMAFPGGGISRSALKPRFAAAAALAAIIAYLLLSTLWSADKTSTLAAALVFLLYAASLTILLDGLERESPGIVQGLSRSLPPSVAAGALFILFELSTDNLLQKAVFSYIPLARPGSPEHVGMLDGRVAFWATDELNPSVALLNLLAWPALLAIPEDDSNAFAWVKRAGLLFLLAAATFASEHDASKIALLCAAMFFGLSWRWPNGAIRAVAAGFIAACLAAVPLVREVYREGWHLSTAIPVNGRARLIIWDATAAKVKEHPILGVGANSTKFLSEQSPGEERPGNIIPWATGNHAHNVFLQTWYELGAAGVALLALLALTVLSAISRMRGDIAPYALAVFCSAVTINSLSWSLWYPWVLASLFLAPFLMLLVSLDAQNRGPRTKSP